MREHILRECPTYAQHRGILRIPSDSIALLVILGTKKGIIALTTFLKKSGAFTRTGTTKTPPKPPEFRNEPEAEEEDEETPQELDVEDD